MSPVLDPYSDLTCDVEVQAEWTCDADNERVYAEGDWHWHWAQITSPGLTAALSLSQYLIPLLLCCCIFHSLFYDVCLSLFVKRYLPSILAYKSLSRISRPLLKNRVRMWSKIIDPRISRCGFWGLLLDASFANNKLNRGLLFRCMHGRHLQRRHRPRLAVGEDGDGVDVTADA